MGCPAFPEAPVLRQWLLVRPWRGRRRMLPERFAEQRRVRPERAREIFEMCRCAGVFRKWYEVSCPRCGLEVGSFLERLPAGELECPDCGEVFAPGAFPWRVAEVYELVEPGSGVAGGVCAGVGRDGLACAQ